MTNLQSEKKAIGGKSTLALTHCHIRVGDELSIEKSTVKKARRQKSMLPIFP